MLAKKRARRANAYVPDALQEGCEILMQSFLGGHNFTSWPHPTTLRHIYCHFNAISQFTKRFGIPLPKLRIPFPLPLLAGIKALYLRTTLKLFFNSQKIAVAKLQHRDQKCYETRNSIPCHI